MPAVLAVDGGDLIMERLYGRDMLADLTSRPWRTARHGRVLAALHDQLHQIAAPEGLRRPFGTGDRIVHLDLHPGNVMLTAGGPVVIDWTNAAAGPPGSDVAMAYLIMASSDLDALPWWLRPGTVHSLGCRDTGTAPAAGLIIEPASPVKILHQCADLDNPASVAKAVGGRLHGWRHCTVPPPGRIQLRHDAGQLSWPGETCCRHDDAGDHPGVLTAVQIARPRGERPGAFVVGRSPCKTSPSRPRRA